MLCTHRPTVTTYSSPKDSISIITSSHTTAKNPTPTCLLSIQWRHTVQQLRCATQCECNTLQRCPKFTVATVTLEYNRRNLFAPHVWFEIISLQKPSVTLGSITLSLANYETEKRLSEHTEWSKCWRSTLQHNTFHVTKGPSLKSTILAYLIEKEHISFEERAAKIILELWFASHPNNISSFKIMVTLPAHKPTPSLPDCQGSCEYFKIELRTPKNRVQGIFQPVLIPVTQTC